MKKKNLCIGILAAMLTASMLAGCSLDTSRQAEKGYLSKAEEEEEEESTARKKKTEEEIQEEIAEDELEAAQAQENEEQDGEDSDEQIEEEEKDRHLGLGRHIVIDPGHQEEANEEYEFIGPGSSETKMKCSLGSKGVATEVDEYELNLEVAYWLQEELEDRGYEVVLTRESNDVDMSNAERAQFANDIDPTAFIRIHADASSDPDTNGVMTICQTAENPFNGYLYDACYQLSLCIQEDTVAATEATDLGVWQTDTLTGINYSTVPVCQVQVGYLSNEEEDLKLSKTGYQKKLAQGIADGIDDYVRILNGEVIEEAEDAENAEEDTENADDSKDTEDSKNTDKTQAKQ